MTSPPIASAAGFESVLEFWLGDLDPHGLADPTHKARWFKSDPEFDQTLRDRFGAEHAAIVDREREPWLATERGRLAYVVVLDQFSRNMFRHTGQMFAADAQALRVALAGIDAGGDRRLRVHERVFLYMPLMHSESVDAQDRCVRLFASLRDELSGPAHESIASNHEYAVRHRDIVARFGRFPHRNELLGRATTPEEAAFLKQPGSSFG